MTHNNSDSDKDIKRVRSDLAAPYRPADSHDLLQPIAPVSPVAPPATPVPDSDLADDVNRCLLQDGRLADCVIKLSVRDGIVTVEGMAEKEYQRTLVTATVNQIPGVLNVRNLLVVR
jgi:hypothetical protein